MMNWDLIIVLSILDIPLFLVIAWLIFGGLPGISEAVYFSRKNDYFSAMDGEYAEDRFSQFCIIWFVATCGAFLAAEWALIQKFFPSLLDLDLTWLWTRWEQVKASDFIHFYSIEPIPLGIVILANFPVYYLLIRLFFGGLQGFKLVLFHALKPDWLSAMDGEYDKDYMATNAFVIFLVACGIIVMGEYSLYQLISFLMI